MSIDLILSNVLNPPVLFFFAGMLAVFLKSDLEIPQPIAKLFSLYLLISIGLHGGYELSKSGITPYIIKVLGFAMFMAIFVPIYTFFILRLKLDVYNAVAVAATYGSISAVTFLTALSFLQQLKVPSGGYVVAAMTLMESPAIIIGLVLLSIFAKNRENSHTDWKEVLRESFLNTSVYLLLVGLIVGYVTGENGWKGVEPVFGNLFKGFLTFFLLDMGIIAAKRIRELRKVGAFLLVFAIVVPVINALIAVFLTHTLGIQKGDAFLLTVLSASASYIAVPAAMRLSVPEANPSIYVPMSLALTFPFNISVGIPLYYYLVNMLWG